jgi:16S rRNA processing protein RimM
MNREPFVRIGRVNRTHGLKGEVSVTPFTEAPLYALEGIELWFVPPSSVVRSAILESVRQGPKGMLLTLRGISGIDLASAFIGREVLVRAEDVPDGWEDDVDADESFDGFTVHDEEHGLLGEIVETIITGANDVWIVEGPLGQVLLPVIDDVVLEIDEENRTVKVELLRGLLDEPGDRG